MISRRDSLDDKAWSTLFVAWLSPTIQRIVVGIRTNLTQQVRARGPFNNAGDSDLVRIIYFFLFI